MASRVTPAVKWLIIANVGVFIVQSLLSRTAWQPTEWLGLSARAVVARGMLWQLATYAFLHANLMHILFNMLFLYWFGCDVEVKFGTRRFLWFYFGAAVAAGLAFVLVYAVSGRWGAPAIGASGAVMGVMVLAAIFWPNRIILAFFFFPMKLRTFVLLAIAIDLHNEIFATRTGVAGMAHLGGAAYGFLYLRLYPWWTAFRNRTRRLRENRGQNQSLRDEEELDRILDKVHERGMHTLTQREKRFLKGMSRRKNRKP